jgi:hypothetical protein
MFLSHIISTLPHDRKKKQKREAEEEGTCRVTVHRWFDDSSFMGDLIRADSA